MLGGTFYDEEATSNVKNIVNDIDKTAKTLVDVKEETKRVDKPEILVIVLTISTLILFILNKRVKL